MRASLFAFLFLLPVSVWADDGFRILWWNIEKGITNQNTENDALNRNLRKLIRNSEAPDILLLGEFEYDAIRPETLRALRKSYSEKFLHYNMYASDTGVAVFAKKGIRVETFPLRELEWTQDAREREVWLKENHEAYLYDRYYLRFRFSRGNQMINIVPVHLLMPWIQIKERYPSVVGKAVVGLELLFGTDNPLARQAESLKNVLEADFGSKLNGEPVVLIGDFNVPKSIGGVLKTHVYRTLMERLVPAFRKEQRTFPATESDSFGKYPSLQLDHAFGSKDVVFREASVLNFAGSDHYPISVIAMPERHASGEYCQQYLK